MKNVILSFKIAEEGVQMLGELSFNELAGLAKFYLEFSGEWHERLKGRLLSFIGHPISQGSADQLAFKLVFRDEAAKVIAYHFLEGDEQLMTIEDVAPLAHILLEYTRLEIGDKLYVVLHEGLGELYRNHLETRVKYLPKRPEMTRWMETFIAVAKGRLLDEVIASKTDRLEIWRRTFGREEYIAHMIQQTEEDIAVITKFRVRAIRNIRGLEPAQIAEMQQVADTEEEWYPAVRTEAFRWLTEEVRAIYG